MDTTTALTHHLQQLQANGRSPHTLGQVRRHGRVLAAWLESQQHTGDVGQITAEHLAGFLTSPEATHRPDGRPKKASATNALRSSLRGWFCYLHEAGHITANPARLIRQARCGRAVPQALSEDEQNCLLSTLKGAAKKDPVATRDYLLVHLLLGTGLRLGSALALRVGDIDLANSTIHVRVTKFDQPTDVFFGSTLRTHLKRAMKGHDADSWLFQGAPDHPLCHRQARRRVEIWAQRAGMTRNVSPHTLRHSFAMSLYGRTGDLLVVQRALAHRSISSTMAYARADDQRVQAALI